MQTQMSHPLVLYNRQESDSPTSFIPHQRSFGAMSSGALRSGNGTGSIGGVPPQLASPADLIEIMSRTSPRDKLPNRRSGSRGNSLAADRGRKKHAEESRFGEKSSERRRRPERPRSVGGPQDDDGHQPISHHSKGEHRRHAMKQRSQSLGVQSRKAPSDAAGSMRPIYPVPPPQPQTLNLYHVSRPEPRARWVFNLSKHTNVVSNGPPPDIVTSTIDVKRPNLGGLVWINATLGGHCCLQKGTKSRTVTPVPANVLDGWLNGQTGLWWIGALKEGHRALWDSHVVKSWAMVFIPSSPEIAARNNMEVYKDKCLKGSLRVSRPGELARKIVDIVTDDQDAEPEAVVHTHLCILLAEGDDLELKRPRMFQSTSRPNLESQHSSIPGSADRVMRHSKSLGNLSSGTGAGNPVDLSQVTLDDNGVPKLLQNSSGEGAEEAPGQDGNRQAFGSPLGGGGGGGGGNPQTLAELQEALHKVEQYRGRILILKEDRQSKKALVAQLKDDMREKEDLYSAENERLRQERNEIKERARMLWIDLENLRSSHAEVTAGCLTVEHADTLRAQVDRLRRERNEARSDAIRWLEQQQQPHHQQRLPGPSPATVTSHSFPDDLRSGSGNGIPSAAGAAAAAAASANEVKAAVAIQKLKAKVERLRKERDGAEKQATVWLESEKERLKQELTSAALPAVDQTAGTWPEEVAPVGGFSGVSDGDGLGINGVTGGAAAGGKAKNTTLRSEGGDSGGGGGGMGPRKSSGPVVASLKAESSRLKKELDESRKEAKRWRDRAVANDGVGGGGGELFSPARGVSLAANASAGNGSSTYPEEEVDSDSANEESGARARRDLGQLLGQAMHLLGPKGAEAGAGASTEAGAASAVAGNHPQGGSASRVNNGGMGELLEVSAAGGE